MKCHVMIDRRTGEAVTVGRDGRRYTSAEVERAKREAARGDAAAQAVIANIDLTADFADTDPQEMMRQLVHDCPECRAAAAMGLVPSFGTGEDLRARRSKPKRLRWREQRRRKAG